MTVDLPQLRWILLLLGTAFLAGLAWWELRRPRHAQHGEPGLSPGTEAQPAYRSELERDSPLHRDLPLHREPTITLPEIRARDPLAELPTFEIVDESLTLRAIDEAPAAEDASLLEAHVEPIPVRPPDREPPDAPPAAAAPAAVAPAAAAPAAESLADESAAVESLAAESPRAESLAAESPAWPPPAAVSEIFLGPRGAPLAVPLAPPEPIVEWPATDARQVLALRLVAVAERFPGYAVRQALAAEGFVLGKFDIFHRPGADGRAIVSAASLSNPGTFDRGTLDTQRFGGLSLFAVLPGPLPPARAFDELIGSARNLCSRLEGQLQDERGEALTAQRAAEMRAAAGGLEQA